MSVPEQRVTIAVADAGVSGVYAEPSSPWATVVVAHGAGADMDHPFLQGFSRALGGEGVATFRFNFPYMEAGRKFPDRPPVAVEAWRSAMRFATAQAAGWPVWAAGKSFGGRMASMAAAEGMPAAGLVYLGYPLHPPGKPEKVRDDHLYGMTLPMLFLQGTRDPFATPGLLENVVARIGTTATLQWIEGGNHSFGVRGAGHSAADAGASLAGPVASYLSRIGRLN